MSPIAIVDAGLVTSVGLSAEATCAAIRASVTNPTETRFVGGDGKWLLAQQVPMPEPWRGRARLVEMASMATAQVLAPRMQVASQALQAPLPLLLCVAEQDRPGRLEGLDDALFAELEVVLGVPLHPSLSGVVPQGRVGVALALAQAHRLMVAREASQVLIVAVDSLLVAATLDAYGAKDRLLGDANSNGFVPGEAAGALLVAAPEARHDWPIPQIACLGIGYGNEPASIDTDLPLRGEGLMQAMKGALDMAGLAMAQVGYRIATLNGEQYGFKEFDLATSRLLRGRHEFMDLWHPADCVGEVGAAQLAVCMAMALAAARKGFAPGDPVLIAASNDDGRRVAMVVSAQGDA